MQAGNIRRAGSLFTPRRTPAFHRRLTDIHIPTALRPPLTSFLVLPTSVCCLYCISVPRYALHFLVIYGVAFASINYATRFNDEDAWHTLFWVAFLFGIFGQVRPGGGCRREERKLGRPACLVAEEGEGQVGGA